MLYQSEGQSVRLAVTMFVTTVAMGYATSAMALTLFDDEWDGNDLPTLAAVNFEVPHSPGPGNSLLIDATGGPDSRNRLFTWYLIPAFKPEGIIVSVYIDYTPVGGADNDPIFGFTDFTNFSGWQRSDDSNGSWHLVEGAYGPTAPIPGAQILSNVGPVGAMDAEINFRDGLHGGSIQGHENAFLTGNIELQAEFAIDTDRPLIFAMFGESGGETYQINSIRMFISPSGVTEPSVPTGPWWILASALVAVAYRARRAFGC